MAYKHHGFWKAMDTISDKHYLENIWQIVKFTEHTNNMSSLTSLTVSLLNYLFSRISVIQV